MIDSQGRQLYVDDAFCAMTGFSRDELLGASPPHPYWAPEGMPSAQAALERGIAGEAERFELLFLRRDGSTFPASVSVSAVEVGAERVLLGVVKDLSLVRERQERFESLQGLIDAMVRSDDLAFWQWEPGQGPIEVSDSYYRMLGFEPGAWPVSYEEWAKRVHPDDIGKADRAMQELLSGKSRLYDVEFRIRNAKDEWHWVLSRAYVSLCRADGEPAQVTGTHQDIQRLKGQEARLRELEKIEVLGQLTSGIAHDFNNVLAVMLGSVDLLRDDPREDQVRLLDAVGRALERAQSLTRSLLDYARRTEGEREPVEVDLLVADNEGMLRAALLPKANLELELGAPGVRVEVDRSRLSNALLNLVVNARDAIERRGVVRVETKLEGVAPLGDQPLRAGDYLAVRVIDDGEGMPPEVLARATEALFTTKPAGLGTGLGLAQVRKFVEDERGALAIQSEPGEGTRVTISLPRVRAASGGGGAKVLVVDDEDLLREILCAHLSNAGYSVLEAEGPRPALALLEEEQFDVLLTDLVMPATINGPELARRALALRPSLKVVFMTGFSEETTIAATAELGPLLRKPFALAELHEAIEGVLQI